jgi:hypothetical protein
VQHQLTNQELARLTYAETLRNSSRRHHVVDDVVERQSRTAALVARVRESVAGVFGHVPAPSAS